MYIKNKEANSAKIEFFKTKKVNPIFTFEEGVMKIGECKLHVNLTDDDDLEDKKIETKMNFGGTFIDVISTHLKSGKSVKTTLSFD